MNVFSFPRKPLHSALLCSLASSGLKEKPSVCMNSSVFVTRRSIMWQCEKPRRSSWTTGLQSYCSALTSGKPILTLVLCPLPVLHPSDEHFQHPFAFPAPWSLPGSPLPPQPHQVLPQATMTPILPVCVQCVPTSPKISRKCLSLLLPPGSITGPCLRAHSSHLLLLKDTHLGLGSGTTSSRKAS